MGLCFECRLLGVAIAEAVFSVRLRGKYSFGRKPTQRQANFLDAVLADFKNARRLVSRNPRGSERRKKTSAQLKPQGAIESSLEHGRRGSTEMQESVGSLGISARLRRDSALMKAHALID
jgi:hypothetical protein